MILKVLIQSFRIIIFYKFNEHKGIFIAMVSPALVAYGKSVLIQVYSLYISRNMMQVYLISGINTERTLGTTVSSRTVKNEVMKLANQNRRVVDSAIMNAMIDDYTTIDSYHRPTDNKASTFHAMCTIVCRIFPSVPAIPITSLESLNSLL